MTIRQLAAWQRQRRSSYALPLAACVLAACATSGARDDATHARKTPVAVPDPNALDATALSGADAAAAAASNSTASASQGVTALFPVAEGACPSGALYAVGATPVLVIKREAWVMAGPDGGPPRSLYHMADPVYDAFSGRVPEGDHLGHVGGVDEAHAWVQERLSTGRGEDASVLRLRTTPDAWQTLPTPRGQQGFFAPTNIIQQPDGSVWAFAQHSMYLDIPGDNVGGADSSHNRYFAWSARGEPLKINLPGPDMVNAVRMTSGELVAAGLTSTGKPVLRRWSPTKKVDDLVVANAASPASDPVLGVGTTRAVLFTPKQKQHAFYTYAGDKLNASALSSRVVNVGDVGSWLLTSADELMVATADGTLLIESKDGAVSEEKLPEPGRLAAETTTPWLIAKSGALYTRSGSTWVKVAVPNGPWSAETHPPSRVEWVKAVGGETFVSAVRTDVGFGLRKPGEVRVIYSSKARTAPQRCGAPFPVGTLAAFPSVGSSCTNLVVVVASERERDQKSEYPKLGAALKDDATTLGESLTFVGFGAGPIRMLGILASTPEIAKQLVKKLSRVAASEPEIVCGAPDERRRLYLRVKTGAFSSSQP